MIRYRDLRVRRLERKQQLSTINKILKSGKIIDGPQVKQLEDKISAYCGRDYGIAVNSGTSAIYLALRVLGIKPDDEVIVPCLGVVPVVNPILLIGAKPVFVDVCEDYNINPKLITDSINNKTKCVLAVNYAGRVCKYDDILNITKSKGLFLIEDASQSFGASYKHSRAGSFGDISVMSLNPMKVFGAYGEAGMILTNDEETVNRLKQMRYNGLIDKIISNHISLNFRLDTTQAATLLNKFERLEHEIIIRRHIAQLYTNQLKDMDMCMTPTEEYNEYCTYFTYNIRVGIRDGLYDYLLDNGIEIQKRDSVLLPHQLPNRSEYSNLRFPVGDEIARTSISLPLHNHLKTRNIEFVGAKIKEFYGGKNQST